MFNISIGYDKYQLSKLNKGLSGKTNKDLISSGQWRPSNVLIMHS